VFEGGVHILPMAVAGVGTYALFAAMFSRSWRPAVVGLAFFGLGFAYAAPKLLPVSLYVTGDTFWDTRNATEHPDRMTIEMLSHAYLDPNQHTGLSFELQRHRWQEYGNYIGPLAALVIAAGVVAALIARERPGRASPRALGVTALVLFALSLGELGSWAPASLVQSLPLFSSFRIPSRYAIPFTLFGTLAAGSAIGELMSRRRLTTPVARTIAAICILGSLHLVVRNRHFFERVFRDAPGFSANFELLSGPSDLAIDRDSNPYRPGSPMLRALMADQSFFSCYESLQVKRTADGDHPLVYADGDVTVSDVRFSPNEVSFSAVSGSAPSRVYLNQNFANGWTSTAGPVAREQGTDRLSVALVPGQTGRFVFRFTPPGLWVGTMIAAIAAAASSVVWLRGRRLRASQ
jgi:hypothetical protein